MLDADPLRTSKARGLLTTSSIVVVYVLAGGEVTDHATVLGGTISIERPYMLEVAGAALFVYMLLRFLFPRESLLRPVTQRACQRLDRSRSFQQFVERCAQAANPNRSVEFDGRPLHGANQANAWKDKKGNWRSSVEMYNTSDNSGRHRASIELDAGELKRYLIWPFILTVLLDDAGRENVWPLFLAAAALTLGVLYITCPGSCLSWLPGASCG